MNMEWQSENAEISRPLANYLPDVWGDRFLANTPRDEVTQSKMEEEAKELKKRVQNQLLDVIENPKKRLDYVDAIHRLGVLYHFEEEIEDNLKNFRENQLDCDNNYEDDLHYVSLRFRLLRQHGFYVSPDVFKKFKCEKGSFKDCLTSDVQGLLSLYEASYLRVHGEHILDDALAFATTHLTSFATLDLSSPMAKQTAHALKIPMHKRSIRLESRHQIAFYESNPSHDKTLLRFAKIDFNLLQELHKRELRDCTRWSRSLDLLIKLPKFMRDRVTEGYYWTLGAYYEPNYSFARMCTNKIFRLISIVDDLYDAYGTTPELDSFTEAIQRWDKSCIDDLPEYIRLFYEAILDTFQDIEKDLAREGRSYAICYLQQQFMATCRAYLVEAKWRHKKFVPSYDDYFKNGLSSSGYLVIAAAFMLGMGEIATKEAFEWINHNSKAPRASCIITRLLDDIAGHKFEQTREHVASSVECYMRQFGTSEEEAYKQIQLLIEEAWKDINEEILGPIVVPKPVLNLVINITRLLYDLFQIGEDGYTIPKYSQPKIAAVLINPVVI